MRVSRETTVGALLAILCQEIEARKTAVAMLEALIASGASPPTPTMATAASYRRQGNKKPSISVASVRILREAARPMHGVRELVPALAARGIHLKHPSGLGSLLLRTGQIERTAPGTYAAKGGVGVMAT